MTGRLEALLNDIGIAETVEQVYGSRAQRTETGIAETANIPDPGPGMGSVLNDNTGEEFNSIGDALDEVQEGETVLVGPGTYEESVSVLEDDVVLEGIDNPVIEGLCDEAVGIDLRGLSGITIRGFTIQNFQNLVELRGSNNTIEHNILKGITPDSPGFGEGFYDQSRRGVNLDGADNTLIQNNTIETCSRGIRLGGFGDKNNLVTENYFHENFRGIAINSPANTIEDNQVLNSQAYSEAVEENVGSPSGIRTFDTGSESTIKGNTVKGSHGYGISIRGDGEDEISGNTVKDNDQAGIFIWDVDTGVTIEENDIFENNWMGIRVLESEGHVIDNNQINDNGEFVEDDEFFSGVRLLESDNNEFTDNTLDENYADGVLVWDSDDNVVTENDVALRDDEFEKVFVLGDSEGNTIENNQKLEEGEDLSVHGDQEIEGNREPPELPYPEEE